MALLDHQIIRHPRDWARDPFMRAAALGAGWGAVPAVADKPDISGNLALFEAIMYTESLGNNLALSPEPDNCVGLVQFHYQENLGLINRKYGEQVDAVLATQGISRPDVAPEDFYRDPRVAVVYGGFVWQDQFEQLQWSGASRRGNTLLALQGYNGGTDDLSAPEGVNPEAIRYPHQVGAYLAYQASHAADPQPYVNALARLRDDAERVGQLERLNAGIEREVPNIAWHERNMGARIDGSQDMPHGSYEAAFEPSMYLVQLPSQIRLEERLAQLEISEDPADKQFAQALRVVLAAPVAGDSAFASNRALAMRIAYDPADHSAYPTNTSAVLDVSQRLVLEQLTDSQAAIGYINTYGLQAIDAQGQRQIMVYNSDGILVPEGPDHRRALDTSGDGRVERINNPVGLDGGDMFQPSASGQERESYIGGTAVALAIHRTAEELLSGRQPVDSHLVFKEVFRANLEARELENGLRVTEHIYGDATTWIDAAQSGYYESSRPLPSVPVLETPRRDVAPVVPTPRDTYIAEVAAPVVMASLVPEFTLPELSLPPIHLPDLDLSRSEVIRSAPEGERRYRAANPPQAPNRTYPIHVPVLPANDVTVVAAITPELVPVEPVEAAAPIVYPSDRAVAVDVETIRLRLAQDFTAPVTALAQAEPVVETPPAETAEPETQEETPAQQEAVPQEAPAPDVETAPEAPAETEPQEREETPARVVLAAYEPAAGTSYDVQRGDTMLDIARDQNALLQEAFGNSGMQSRLAFIVVTAGYNQQVTDLDKIKGGDTLYIPSAEELALGIEVLRAEGGVLADGVIDFAEIHGRGSDLFTPEATPIQLADLGPVRE